MYWCVFVLPFRLLPHTRFTISLAHKNDAHVCIYCWKAASWYVTYVTPESYVPREPEMVCKRERENERTSEDNANTYFQAAISNVHYLFYLYVASHFDVYDLPQYPFSARTGRGISSFFLFGSLVYFGSLVLVVVVSIYEGMCSVCLDTDNRDKRRTDCPPSKPPSRDTVSSRHTCNTTETYK